MSMSEPTTGAAAGIAAYKAGLLSKAAVAIGAGAIGALAMAAFDPPASRKEMFFQALAASTGSLFFGGAAVRALDAWAAWVDLTKVDAVGYWEWAAPVYFLVGALSWGAFGALAKLRKIIHDKGAARVAKAAGVEE
jgi:hypothetical protein